MATITCQDCGAKRDRCPRNTKYCKPCRLLRDIAYWITRFRACSECGRGFAPLSRADSRCSSCDPGIYGQEIDCVLCQSRARRLIPGIPVCAGCLRDPKGRKKLFEALERGQRQRKEHNNETTQG